MEPIYIGLGGKKRAGKDAYATALREALLDLGIPAGKRSFAAQLKGMVQLLFGASREDMRGDKAGAVPAHVRESTGCATWRELLQKVGVDARVLWPGVWINALFARPKDRRVVVIPDVRFPDEIRAIHDRGGQCYYVERPGACGDAHISENAVTYADFDAEITNDTTLEDLAAIAKIHAASIHKQIQAREGN